MSGLSLGAASALRLVKGQNLAESNIVEFETRTGGKSTTWIGFGKPWLDDPVSYTHLRAHETPEHLVCRLLLEKDGTWHCHG